MRSQRNLIRKQYLVSEDNIQKVDKIANASGTSAAEIVRQAIDAYNPDNNDIVESSDLLELVSVNLKEAIAATQKANRKVSKTLKSLAKVKV